MAQWDYAEVMNTHKSFDNVVPFRTPHSAAVTGICQDFVNGLGLPAMPRSEPDTSKAIPLASAFEQNRVRQACADWANAGYHGAPWDGINGRSNS